MPTVKVLLYGFSSLSLLKKSTLSASHCHHHVSPGDGVSKDSAVFIFCHAYQYFDLRIDFKSTKIEYWYFQNRSKRRCWTYRTTKCDIILRNADIHFSSASVEKLITHRRKKKEKPPTPHPLSHLQCQTEVSALSRLLRLLHLLPHTNR